MNVGTLARQQDAWSVFLQARRRERLPTSGGSVPTVPPPTAFWRFEEATGTRFDSVGAHHLTEVNTVGQAAGKAGFAASFNRLNGESFDTDDHVDLRPENDSFSLSVWVYIAGALVEGYAVVSKFDESGGSGNPDREYCLFILPSGGNQKIRVVLGDDGGNDYDRVGVGNVTSNTWHHIAVTFDRGADTLKFYRDGALDATFTDAPQLQDGTFHLMVGRADLDQSFFNGRLDALAWLKGVVLTPAHVGELFTGLEFYGGAWH